MGLPTPVLIPSWTWLTGTEELVSTRARRTSPEAAKLSFPKPRGGTLFMQCAQSVGIDLPFKALVREDASPQVWAGYIDPALIVQRHGVEQSPWSKTCA